MSRLPKSAHFITVLAYLPSPDDLPACYKGPLYLEGDADDPADVLRDLQRCVELLNVEYDLASEAIRLWLSGGRSIHMTIPPHVIGADAGHALLPDIYRTMIETLLPKTMAASLDRSIYNRGKGRMWRLPNRRRTDTGKCKVPIAVAELLHKPYPELEAMTHKPRRGVFWPAETDLDSCRGLVELYHQVRAQVEADATRAAGRHGSGRYEDSWQDGAGVFFHAFQARGWLGDEIEPGKWAVLCPWASSHTKGTDFDTSTVIFGPRAGETLGKWYCSHAHCEGRTFEDVLALFSEQELIQARAARGLRTIAAEEVTAWRR
jgi:hypothetical protein